MNRKVSMNIGGFAGCAVKLKYIIACNKVITIKKYLKNVKINNTNLNDICFLTLKFKNMGNYLKWCNVIYAIKLEWKNRKLCDLFGNLFPNNELF